MGRAALVMARSDFFRANISTYNARALSAVSSRCRRNRSCRSLARSCLKIRRDCFSSSVSPRRRRLRLFLALFQAGSVKAQFLLQYFLPDVLGRNTTPQLAHGVGAVDPVALICPLSFLFFPTVWKHCLQRVEYLRHGLLHCTQTAATERLATHAATRQPSEQYLALEVGLGEPQCRHFGVLP
jgi:hypothetical protein